MKPLWRNLFFGISLLHMAGIVAALPDLAMFTKPLLMPILALAFYTADTHHDAPIFLRRAVLAALFFSTLGDVFLMLPHDPFFLPGLASFLIAHLCYIAGFRSLTGWKSGYLKEHVWWIALFACFPLALLSFLWPGIPAGMRVPVALYGTVITTMALSVLNLNGRLAVTTFRSLMTGALLFVASDSLLALSLFGQPFDGQRIAVMSTYILGQWFLVSGSSWIGRRPE